MRTSFLMMRCHLSQRRFPSILAKTLPPSSMGFGWRGTGAALLVEIRCFPHHRDRHVYAQRAVFGFGIWIVYNANR